MTTSRFLLASQRSGGSLNNIIKRAIVSGNLNFPLINQHQSQTMATSAKRKLITLESMNPNMIKMEYAVRGPLVIRAAEIEKELKAVSSVRVIINWRIVFNSIVCHVTCCIGKIQYLTAEATISFNYYFWR